MCLGGYSASFIDDIKKLCMCVCLTHIGTTMTASLCCKYLQGKGEKKNLISKLKHHAVEKHAGSRLHVSVSVVCVCDSLHVHARASGESSFSANTDMARQGGKKSI